MPNQLESYQKVFVENISKALENDKSILAQLSTGGGKTVVFASIVNDYINSKHRDVLIVVHRQELLNQTRRVLSKWYNVGSEKIDVDNKNIQRSKVYVGMVETLKNRLKDTKTFNLMKNVGLVIIDEAHMSNFKKIFPHFPAAQIIGFTASPIHATKKDPIKNYYDDIVVGCSIGELINLNQTIKDRGLVQNLTYSIANINRDELKLNITGDDYDEKFMGEKFSNKKQIQNTVDAYNKYSFGKKAICFNASVDHSKRVTDEMRDAGLNARHLDGGHDASYREECFRWLKNTPDAILCNVGIATTGFDEPSIQTVIVNSAMKSLSYWLQKCGRGARPCMDINKRNFIILDLGANALAHGDWNDERDWEDIFHNPYIPQNGKSPVKACPECRVLNAAAARTCKNCGFEFPLPSAEEDTVQRDLVLITKVAHVEKIIEHFMETNEPIEIPGFENYLFNATGDVIKMPDGNIVEYVNGYATITNVDGIDMDFSRRDIEDLIAHKLFTEKEYEDAKTSFIEASNNGFINHTLTLQLINAEMKIWEARLEELDENSKLAWAEARHCKREKAAEYALAARDADEALELHRSKPYGDIHALILEEDKKLKDIIEKLKTKSEIINKILTSEFKDDGFLPQPKKFPTKRITATARASTNGVKAIAAERTTFQKQQIALYGSQSAWIIELTKESFLKDGKASNAEIAKIVGCPPESIPGVKNNGFIRTDAGKKWFADNKIPYPTTIRNFFA